MNYSITTIEELSNSQYYNWKKILNNNGYYSPFFHPDFFLAISNCRRNVFLCVFYENDEAVGFFPFEKKGKIGRPVGLGLSDYHGVISESNEWNESELLKACGIIRFEYDHLYPICNQFSSGLVRKSESPLIDISNGSEVYRDSLDKNGRKQYRETLRKKAKLEEIGSVSYIRNSSKDDLSKLIEWKSEQCRLTGVYDFFSVDWCMDLISNLFTTQKDDFGGMLSSLYVGEELAAVHFGMYTNKVWHYWFPTYNQKFHSYSPGSILLNEIIMDASASGISYIDLGKGLSTYKKRVMNGCQMVGEGTVFVPSFRNNLYFISEKLVDIDKKSLLYPLYFFPSKVCKRLKYKNRFK